MAGLVPFPSFAPLHACFFFFFSFNKERSGFLLWALSFLWVWMVCPGLCMNFVQGREENSITGLLRLTLFFFARHTKSTVHREACIDGIICIVYGVGLSCYVHEKILCTGVRGRWYLNGICFSFFFFFSFLGLVEDREAALLALYGFAGPHTWSCQEQFWHGKEHAEGGPWAARRLEVSRGWSSPYPQKKVLFSLHVSCSWIRIEEDSVFYPCWRCNSGSCSTIQDCSVLI